MSGALLLTDNRYLDANTDQKISIKKLLGDAGFFAQVGSVEVVSPENSAALLGQLSVTRTDANKEYLDEELFMPPTTGSRTLRAVIDSPQNSPIVAVTNVSPTVAQTLQVSCLSNTGPAVAKTVNLQPKQTRLVRACSTLGDAAFSPDAVDSQFILQPESPLGMSGQNVAGISITADGPAGEIAAFGFVEHDDTFGRYFSAMNFADPGLLNSTATVFAGVPAGPSATATGLAYTPQVALTNFSDAPQTAAISFATTTAGLSDLRQAAQVALPAHTSRLVNLSSLTGSPRWQNSFIVRSSGQPGDVLSKMMFKTVGPLPNIELIGKDEQDMHNAGDHPWSVEDGLQSTLYLFNHGDTTRKVSVRIGAGSNVWLKMYDIHPNETMSISIGDFIQRGTTDDKGFAFPRSTTNGEISWWAPKAGAPEVSGRVVQTDSSGSMARNFSCGTEIGLCDIDIDPAVYGDYFEIDDGGSSTMPAQPNYCVYSPPSYSSCPTSGQTTNQTTYLTWEWSSQQPSIAAITSGANTSTATWQGMSPGSTQFSVTATANEENYCTEEGTMTVTTPTITQSQQLWYFGGNPAPSGFTLGGTTATLTANGGGNGTYTWSITAGNSIAALQGTTSGNNLTLVTIASTSYSLSAGDVTVQLAYTPSEGSTTNITYTVSVDSPYQLMAGSVANRGVTSNCTINAPSGTNGWQSLPSYTIMSFFGIQITHIGVNETFAQEADDYIGNNWSPYNAGATTSADGTFVDNICEVYPTGTPPSLPPSSPLGTLKVDHGSQIWFIGSLTEGSGIEVQSDILQKYQDHGLHLSAISPTR